MSHLPNDDRPTRVVVISDGAFSPVSFSPPDGTTVDFIGVGEAVDNVGITAFALRPLPSSSRDFDVMMEVLNATDAPVRTPFEVRAEGTLIDAGELEIPAGETLTHRVRQFSEAGGTIEVFVDHEDAFLLDNHVYAVLPEPEQIRVALVTEGNAFLESALATDDLVVLETVRPGDYASSRQTPDVWVFDRWTPDVAPEVDAMYVGEWPAGWNVVTGERLTTPFITDWDREHPINRGIQWSAVNLREAIKFPATDGFRALVRSFDDSLVAIREAGGIQTLAVAFDPATSDFPLRVAFPMFTANVLRYIHGASERSNARTVPAGTVLSAADVKAFSGKPLAAIQRNHKFSDEAIPLGALDDDSAVFPIRETGVYAGVTPVGESIPLFAVNVCSAEESHIAPSRELPTAGNTPPATSDGFKSGVEPWYVLAALAFFLLCGEWLLFHRRWVE